MTESTETRRGIDARRVLSAEFTALPGREDEVRALITEFAERVRQEPGNLVFAVNRKEWSAREFFVYEEYEDEAAFQAHLSADHGVAFNISLAPLVVNGGSALTFLTPL